MNKAQQLLSAPATTSSGFKPPRAGSRGTYHCINGDSTGFTVERAEGNLCWACYDNAPNEVMPFIFKFKRGNEIELNRLHNWPGKTVTMANLMELAQS